MAPAEDRIGYGDADDASSLWVSPAVDGAPSHDDAAATDDDAADDAADDDAAAAARLLHASSSSSDVAKPHVSRLRRGSASKEEGEAEEEVKAFAWRGRNPRTRAQDWG